MNSSNNTCYHCKRTLPAHLMSPVINGAIGGSVCGQCALYLTNKVLGIERTKFGGAIAESVRLQAIEHYEKTNQIFDYENS